MSRQNTTIQRELLPSFDGYSVLLPDGSNGALKIITSMSGVEEIFADPSVEAIFADPSVEAIFADPGVEAIFADPDAEVDVYDLNGVMIKRACRSNDLKQLTPAVYILRKGNIIVKTAIR